MYLISGINTSALMAYDCIQNSAYNNTIAKSLDDLNSRLLSIENTPLPITYDSLYVQNLSVSSLIGKNISGDGRTGLTAKSALSSTYCNTANYAKSVASHQLSSHTNWTTYFSGTSAKNAINAYKLQGKTSADFYPMNTNPNDYLTSSTLMDVNWKLDEVPGRTFNLSSITTAVANNTTQINFTIIPRTNYLLSEMSGKLDTNDAFSTSNSAASAYIDYGSISAFIINVVQQGINITNLSSMVLEISGKLPT